MKMLPLILDPNEDFRKVNKIDGTLWNENRNTRRENYDRISGKFGEHG